MTHCTCYLWHSGDTLHVRSMTRRRHTWHSGVIATLSRTALWHTARAIYDTTSCCYDCIVSFCLHCNYNCPPYFNLYYMYFIFVFYCCTMSCECIKMPLYSVCDETNEWTDVERLMFQLSAIGPNLCPQPKPSLINHLINEWLIE